MGGIEEVLRPLGNHWDRWQLVTVGVPQLFCVTPGPDLSLLADSKCLVWSRH